jgi:hypothetical protein
MAIAARESQRPPASRSYFRLALDKMFLLVLEQVCSTCSAHRRGRSHFPARIGFQHCMTDQGSVF